MRMRILCDAYLTKLKEGEDQQDDRGVKFKAKAGLDHSARYIDLNIRSFLKLSCLYTPSIKRMRIIALSATLPNLADIGDWLQCAPEVCILYSKLIVFSSSTSAHF